MYLQNVEPQVAFWVPRLALRRLLILGPSTRRPAHHSLGGWPAALGWVDLAKTSDLGTGWVDLPCLTRAATSR